MLRHLGFSLYRLGIGYGLACVSGVAVGSVCGFFSDVRQTARPVLDLLISLPTIAWVPLLLLWLGLGDATVVAAVFLGSFFAVCLNAMRGVESVEPELVEAAALDGANWARTLWSVALPVASPSVVAGLRLGWAYAWRALVGAEMLAAMVKWGLGKMIYEARYWNDVGTMLVGLALLGLCGAALDRGMRWASRSRYC